MSVTIINGHTVAVCIMQPSLALVLPDGTVWRAQSTPLPLRTSQPLAQTVLGFTGIQPPVPTGEAEREPSEEELEAEAIFVPLMSEFVGFLRSRGYSGQILTPGAIRPSPDGQGMAAHHSTVVVLDPVDGRSSAERAYARYNHLTGGLNWQGQPCPRWSELPESIRMAWRAVVDPSAPEHVWS